MPRMSPKFREFPDVQACLKEMWEFLNTLHVENEEHRFLTKPLEIRLLRVSSAVCVLVGLFDPGREYIKTGSCPDGLPRC